MQNKTVARYMELKETIALLTKEMDKIKDQMKEKGSFETEEFVVNVQVMTQTRTVSADNLCDILGFATVMEKGLLKEIEVERVVVKSKAA